MRDTALAICMRIKAYSSSLLVGDSNLGLFWKGCFTLDLGKKMLKKLFAINAWYYFLSQ